MVRPRDIDALLKRRIGYILDVAEAALPADRFPAFRRIVLKEFGDDGFAADLLCLFERDAAGSERNGTGGNHACGKGGAP
jgi:hypothetical protein